MTEYGVVTDEQLWANLEYFLKRVLPVAEKANVKLAMHPDDPPLSPIRGIARIMRSVENFQRLLDLVPSPANGIDLCQGNFTLMTDDLPGVIRQFGKQKKIFFVHFRDVRGTPEKFEETFHDDGKTDMAACMRRLPRHRLRRRLPTGPRADALGRQQCQTELLVDRPVVRHRVHQGASGRRLHRVTARPEDRYHPATPSLRLERCIP